MKTDLLALTPEATIVWPELFEPSSFNSSDEYYRATLLIEKDSDLAPLEQAINAAALKKFPGQSNEFYQQLRNPIRNGALKAVDDNGNPDLGVLPVSMCSSIFLPKPSSMDKQRIG